MNSSLAAREMELRTTLSIDDDVLMVARQLAANQRKSLGKVVSALARQALHADGLNKTAAVRNGVLLLPKSEGALPVTFELVKLLHDVDGSDMPLSL